eukprot:gene12563-6383_t
MIPNKKRKIDLEQESELLNYMKDISKKFDERNDKKERIYKISRDIVIQSKRIIFNLHRYNHKNKEEIFKTVEESFLKIETQLQKIQNELNSDEESYFLFIKSFQFSLEEYIEGISFYFFLKNSTLISFEEVQKFSKFTITLEQYLLGISDLTGELMKYSTNTFNEGDRETPFIHLYFLQQLYICFKSLSYEFPSINQKLYVTENNLKKIEKIYKDAKNYKCECFCGEIQFEVLGFPIVTNCHCSTCRKWTSNSFSTNCVFRLEGLKVTKGKDSIKKMETSKKLIRNFCEKCGGRIYNYGTENDVLTVPLGCIKEDFKDQKITSSELNPSSHICYEERVFDVVDNRIKFQGVPGPGTSIHII